MNFCLLVRIHVKGRSASRHQANTALFWFGLESACVVSMLACVTGSFSGVFLFFLHACQSSGKMVSSSELLL